MSGPVDNGLDSSSFGVETIEVREGRTTNIGRLDIVRVLPTKRRRTIGPWCFVDLMQAEDFSEPPPLEIGPHPHIGLATVTWLLAGTALHTDSLGTEQLIKPGQLNLMTSGRGIAHAEEGVATNESWEGTGTMGVQMWLAQPEDSRHGASRFQHVEHIPTTTFSNAAASVFVGALGDVESPAYFDHPAIGADLTVDGSTVIPVDSAHEFGVVPIDRTVLVEDEIVEPGSVAIVPEGRNTLRLATRSGPGRVILVGGKPLGDEVKMWWNFVARSTDEITEAWRDWQEDNQDRFGTVPSNLPRIDAPTPPWIRADD